tara:strand:- start:7090 stop:7575 length:486 start_codon:yes stop_codon:yes gene_type:complete
MIEQLKRPLVLWVLFVLTLLLTYSFSLIREQWGLTLLDSITSPSDSRGLIGSFTQEQIMVHVWTTAVVDVAYPLAYGLFFAGTALCFFGRFGLYLALPAFTVIPVDLIEGVVQVLGLLGTVDLLDWKAILTPAKFILFFAAMGIAMLGWVVWLVTKIKAMF